MNPIQTVILLTGTSMMLVIVSKFRKKYVMLSRAKIQLARFPSESTRKTRNFYKILSSLVLPHNRQNVDIETTTEDDLREMLIARQAVYAIFNGFAVLVLTVGAYFVFAF